MLFFFFFAEKCSSNLWSTDAAPEVPHPRLMQRDAATREGRRCPRVQLRHAKWFFFLIFFIFIANSCRSGSNSGWFALNWADLGRIGQNGRFRPKFKKKMCETHRLSQILNPTFSSLHTNTPNKLSASLSLRHSSLTLSVLSTSCWLSFILF